MKINICLRIEDLNGSKLVLGLANGVYTIGIQVPALCTFEDYVPIHDEILEEYETCDYKIEEVIERFDKVHNVLKKRSEWEGY